MPWQWTGLPARASGRPAFPPGRSSSTRRRPWTCRARSAPPTPTRCGASSLLGSTTRCSRARPSSWRPSRRTRLHLRRRPLRYRLLALRRHRLARLQLGRTQRATLLSGEVCRALSQPAIAPLGESRSDTDIVFELARRLELDDPLLNPAPDVAQLPGAAFEAAMDWILEPSGMTMAELKQHPGGMPVPNSLPDMERTYRAKGFPTPSGRMEFASCLLAKLDAQLGIEALPTYRPPRHSVEASPDWLPIIPSSSTRARACLCSCTPARTGSLGHPACGRDPSLT